jgi:hypothetical protein
MMCGQETEGMNLKAACLFRIVDFPNGDLDFAYLKKKIRENTY